MFRCDTREIKDALQARDIKLPPVARLCDPKDPIRPDMTKYSFNCWRHLSILSVTWYGCVSGKASLLDGQKETARKTAQTVWETTGRAVPDT